MLPRVLGFWDVVAIVLGTVIGSGIFIVPAIVLRQVGGHLPLALSIWAVAGVLSLLGAITYGELGAMMPEAGGIYVYIRDAYGRFPAFLYGWSMFFVIASGSVATLAVASTGYLGQLIPLTPGAARIVPVILIAVSAALNVRGTRLSARLQGWTTLIKGGTIVVASIALLVAAHPAPAPTGPPAPFSLLSAAGLATVATLWAYEGWQYVTFSAGEVKDPQRTFPLGIALGTGALVVLYLLANVAYVRTLGVAGVARSDRVAADAVTAVFGPLAGRAMAAVVLLAVFSAAHSVILTAPRVFYAMARDGLFFRRLAEVHPRFNTPALAIVTGSLWAMVLAVSGTYEQLLTYVIFAAWIFYGLGALSVFWYRRHRPDAPRPFRVPGYPVTPFLFIVSAGVVVLSTIVTQPLRASIGIGIVLLGTPAYLIWRRSAALVPQ